MTNDSSVEIRYNRDTDTVSVGRYEATNTEALGLLVRAKQILKAEVQTRRAPALRLDDRTINDGG